MVVRESVNTEPGSLNIKRPRELKFHPVIPVLLSPARFGNMQRSIARPMKRESLFDERRDREIFGVFACPFQIESKLLSSFRSILDGLGNLDTEEGGGGIGVITGRPDNWIQLRRN